jgi:hypothetical protein
VDRIAVSERVLVLSCFTCDIRGGVFLARSRRHARADRDEVARMPTAHIDRRRWQKKPMVSFAHIRSARAKVVKGKIVTRAKFPEGTKLFLVVDKPQPQIELDDDEKAFDEAVIAVRRGKTIPLEKFRTILHRL